MIKTPTGNFHIHPLHKGKINSKNISKQPHMIRRLSNDKHDLESIQAVFNSDGKHKRNTHHHKKEAKSKDNVSIS